MFTQIMKKNHYNGLSDYKIPLFLSPVSAGFPSPADDYVEANLDLNSLVIKKPTATYFVRVAGDSMINIGIYEGDLLAVDCSLEPYNNSIVIAILNDELTVKRFLKSGEKLFLIPENDQYETIEIKEEMDFEIWGVVTFVIRSLRG